MGNGGPRRSEEHVVALLRARYAPQAVLLTLIVAGLMSGLYTLMTPGADRDSTLINMFWAAYNLVVLFFGLLLLRQPPQHRRAPRVLREYSCRLQASGLTIDATSIDLSETGMSLQLATAQPIPPAFDVAINSPHGRRVKLNRRSSPQRQPRDQRLFDMRNRVCQRIARAFHPLRSRSHELSDAHAL